MRPHTRQRVAFSLNLVPQVGQVFGVVLVFSGLIIFLDLSVLSLTGSDPSFAGQRDCDILP